MAPNFDSKWAVAPLPTEDAGTSFTGGSDWAVFKDSKNRDTAWKFVDFLTQDAQQQKLYELVGSLPAVQSTWESGELSTDPLLKSFGEQLQDAKSAPAIATWEQVAAPLDDAIEQVSLGKSDAEDRARGRRDQGQRHRLRQLTMATVTAASTAGVVHLPPASDRGRRREVAAGYLFSLPFLVLFLVSPSGRCIARSDEFTDLRPGDIRDPLSVGVGRVSTTTRAVRDETFRKAAVQHGVLRRPRRAADDGRWPGRRGAAGLAASRGSGPSSGSASTCPSSPASWRWPWCGGSSSSRTAASDTALGYVGIDGPVTSCARDLAMPSLIVMAVWRNMGSPMVLFLAGLQGMPTEVREAAASTAQGVGRFRQSRCR